MSSVQTWGTRLRFRVGCLFGLRHKSGLRLSEPKPLRLRHLLLVFFEILGGLFLLGMLGLTVLVVRLSQGPIEVTGLHERISDTLQRQLQSHGQISIGRTFLARGPHGPTLRLEDFSLKDNQGRMLVAAPVADISIAPLALLSGQLAVSGMEFSGLEVKLAVLPDGTMALSAGQGDAIAFRTENKAQNLNPADVFAAVFAATARDAPFFGEIQRVGMTHSRLVVDDRRLDTSTTFADLNLSLDRLGSGGVDLSVSAFGASGPFSVKTLAHVEQTPRFGIMLTSDKPADLSYVLDFQLIDLPVHELALAAGFGRKPIEISMPLSAKGRISFDPNGNLRATAGNFAFGNGFVRFDDPDAQPNAVDQILGDFSFDPNSRHILIPNLEYFSGLTHFKLSGFVAPAFDSNNDHHVSLAAHNAVISPLRPGDAIIPVDSLVFEGAVSQDLSIARIEKLAVKGPELDANFTEIIHNLPEGQAVSGTLDLTRTRVNPVLRIWPSFIAVDLQQWMIEHVNAGLIDKGHLKFDFDAPTLAAAKAKQAIPDASVTTDITFSGGMLTPVPGLPALTATEGVAHVTGTKATILVSKSTVEMGARRLNLSSVELNVPDTRPAKLNPATIGGHVQGNVDALVDLLSRDVLRKYNNIPGEPAQYKGQLDGTVDIAFKIGKTATPDDISVKTSLITSNLSVDKVLGNERLENASLAINTTRNSMSVKGDGRMFGVPVSLELKKAGTAPTDANMVFTLDDAARQKRGLDFGGTVTGPVLVKAAAQLSDGDRTRADAPKGETRALLDVDLAKASIEGLLPGWSKAPGKPGRVTFAMTARADGMQLDQFQLDAGNASFRGAIKLDGAGKLLSAKMTTFRLSPQDDLRLDVQKDSKTLKIVARGGSVDGRPFISDLLAHSRAKSADGLDYDLDLKLNALMGFNKQRVEALDLKMHRRGGVLERVQATGRLGGAALKILPLDATSFSVSADNAGALLSFLDMYRRMEGGGLNMVLKPDAERMSGTVQIHNFLLDNEPAILPLLNQNNAKLSVDGPNRVKFSRLQGSFERGDGRIDLTDAAVWGPQIGATMEGMIDYNKDRVDLAGNLVPAYQINNFFSKIPLVGPLLGGGKNEGLFAINYRITGKASAPFLRVDPLSGIAPGIFRKIMGVADGTATNPNNFGANNRGLPAIQPDTAAPSAPLDLTTPK